MADSSNCFSGFSGVFVNLLLRWDQHVGRAFNHQSCAWVYWGPLGIQCLSNVIGPTFLSLCCTPKVLLRILFQRSGLSSNFVSSFLYCILATNCSYGLLFLFAGLPICVCNTNHVITSFKYIVVCFYTFFDCFISITSSYASSNCLSSGSKSSSSSSSLGL